MSALGKEAEVSTSSRWHYHQTPYGTSPKEEEEEEEEEKKKNLDLISIISSSTETLQGAFMKRNVNKHGNMESIRSDGAPL